MYFALLHFVLIFFIQGETARANIFRRGENREAAVGVYNGL